ncbi:TRAM domain-containing protein [Halorubrum sp. ASP1]|uniref:TRAM domain-containing protein n=1 Tax=Halorubrum sp. ASP1 TaxID=2518114 RepID=UPI0010F7EB86|nr:TRAM domain-containing protein [Halorubrum sp. ASP1]TKX60750.1 TRAM domain-containing protein [Halorubrum sp. ASP1]
MTEIPPELKTLFTSDIEKSSDVDGASEYHIAVPAREVEGGDLTVSENYRIAVLSSNSGHSKDVKSDDVQTDRSSPEQEASNADKVDSDSPPVQEGEVRELEIETIGEQGDGIAKTSEGFVVIVPETQTGDTVTAEIESVTPNVAFAEKVQ